MNSPPHSPPLLSFIIIYCEREPRRTVINKGHLKYEATTQTLGNISSAEQLVPPLSLWKGVPGAAGPCSDFAGSPSPALAAWRLKREGRRGWLMETTQAGQGATAGPSRGFRGER